MSDGGRLARHVPVAARTSAIRSATVRAIACALAVGAAVAAPAWADAVHPVPNPAAAIATAAPATDAALLTTAERTHYAHTGRYAEVETLCRAYAARWPERVQCTPFGTSPEGRPMLALIASRDGAFTPEAARERGRPVVLVQAGIHAGEIDGKDAGFQLLREALEERVAPGALARVTWVFVPVYNVDGHERFGPWHRPNQNGPAEMGWRTTAQNLNLNRDYTKADAPETRAMLALANRWDPILYVDLHVTDGANFQHDVSVEIQPAQGDDAVLAVDAVRLRDEVLADLAAHGSKPLPYYPSFVQEDRPESGFAEAPSLPRFQLGYWAKSGRVAMLVETHSWKDYATRVRITRRILATVLTSVARDAPAWQRAAAGASERAIALAGKPVDLAYENTGEARLVDFLGYAYTLTPSAVSGGVAIVYDPGRPQVWRVPLRDKVRASVTVNAPRGGYLIPPAYAAELEPRLVAHGLRYTRVAQARADAPLERFAISAVKYAAAPFEGRTNATLSGAWSAATGEVAAGSLFVPIAQPKARLVMTLLEPQSPDSFAAWGFFNAAFERKEYMEAYVTEQVAAEMLAKDPALRARFAARLAADPAFAANPEARLEFFFRLHPSWDARQETYPIARSDALY